MEPHSTYANKVADCEAAIARIRAELQAGRNESDVINQSYEQLWNIVKPYFIRNARPLAQFSPLAQEEAVELMVEKLIKAIWNPDNVSMARYFGSYLRDMPAQVVANVRRRYLLAVGGSNVIRLDQPIAADSPDLMYDLVSDDRSAQDFADVEQTMLIESLLSYLPIEQQRVIQWRVLEGWSNLEIAEHFGVSPSTTTRLYQRATQTLKTLISQHEEL